MKQRSLMVFLVLAAVLVVSFAVAAELRGDVSAIDRKAGFLTVEVDGKNVQFESEAGVLPKNVAVKDRVDVKYDEAGGKKKATKIVKVPMGC